MICRLRAAKWRQSHGVIAQCNSAFVHNRGARHHESADNDHGGVSEANDSCWGSRIQQRSSRTPASGVNASGGRSPRAPGCAGDPSLCTPRALSALPAPAAGCGPAGRSQAPAGLTVTPATWTPRVSSLKKHSTDRRRSQTVSTVKKSQATIPAACCRRNARHVVAAPHGAGCTP